MRPLLYVAWDGLKLTENRTTMEVRTAKGCAVTFGSAQL